MRLLAIIAFGLAAIAPALGQYPAPPTGPAPNYRPIIKRALTQNEQVEMRVPPQPGQPKVTTTLPLIASEFAPYEVSGARLVDSLEDWSWVVCLKGANIGPKATAPNVRVRVYRPEPIYIAVFIRGNRIVDSRAGVLADGCAAQQYEPL